MCTRGWQTRARRTSKVCTGTGPSPSKRPWRPVTACVSLVRYEAWYTVADSASRRRLYGPQHRLAPRHRQGPDAPAVQVGLPARRLPRACVASLARHRRALCCPSFCTRQDAGSGQRAVAKLDGKQSTAPTPATDRARAAVGEQLQCSRTSLRYMRAADLSSSVHPRVRSADVQRTPFQRHPALHRQRLGRRPKLATKLLESDRYCDRIVLDLAADS